MNIIQRMVRSVFPRYRGGGTDREFVRGLFRSLVLHFRPLRVPESTVRFTLSWGLGGMAATLVALQFGSGMLLKFVYQPTTIGAYESILHIQSRPLSVSIVLTNTEALQAPIRNCLSGEFAMAPYSSLKEQRFAIPAFVPRAHLPAEAAGHSATVPGFWQVAQV